MIQIARLSGSDRRLDDWLERRRAADAALDPEATAAAAAVLEDVRKRGAAALLEYTNRFERRTVAAAADLEAAPAAMEQALADAPPDLRQALERACARIRDYHQRQGASAWTYQDQEGSTLGQRVTALDRVGIYVPGGKAAYPSSVLMNALPARIAGVGEIIMVTPAPGGDINPLALAAAALAGVDRVFSIGGAQAVAALAYGAGPVPAVDKIVGPGNRYVTAAKRLVFGVVGIDMIAGPSEVAVVADDSANPEWLALDLFAQAEHDEDARAVLVATDPTLPGRVEECMNRQLDAMDRAAVIRAALCANGALIHVENLDRACAIVNQLAPEHLELAVREPRALLPKIRHAGAIFLGHFSAEVLGDYCAGPNHVLPTGGAARFSSPLGVHDFQKRSSLLECTAASVVGPARTAATLARGEGLFAHARSAQLRLPDNDG